MKLTKYMHACIILEEQGQRLIVDPGEWATDVSSLSNVVAIVITHNHFDHFNLKNVRAILQANPAAHIFTTAETANELGNQAKNITTVTEGGTAQAGPFSLQFFGQMHAFITQDKPVTQNVGVLVNDNLYYPGDSFTLPNKAVKTLALPVSGPWLKTSESLDFMLAVKPQLAFPTHDALLSEAGIAVYESLYKLLAKGNNITFEQLRPGQSIEI
ncbi:MAG TPA: MBL fold metallo-hydrolase [Candidatus Saccharimonadales bacterium]|nr:MBL fold metallo-hydrolase [Candidatus Saccharimonadales bacterium]